MRQPGYVSPKRAADMLRVHRNTVYGWAMKAVAGEVSRLQNVVRNPITGFLMIKLSDIEKLKKSHQ